MARKENLRLQAQRFYNDAFRRALEAIAAAGVDIERRMLSTPYPPASRPYTAPHRRKGLLRESIGYSVARYEGVYAARIGARAGHTRGKVLRFLELGTGKMAKRPSLVPMLALLKKRVVPAMKAACWGGRP